MFHYVSEAKQQEFSEKFPAAFHFLLRANLEGELAALKKEFPISHSASRRKWIANRLKELGWLFEPELALSAPADLVVTPAPRYPNIHLSVNLSGPGGNAYEILGTVARHLRMANASPAEIDLFQTSAKSGDYNHLLAVCAEYVDLIVVRS